MNLQKTNYDVVVIGGGASGIMAAISCKTYHPELSVAVIDRTFALGRKILVSGAGRCNVTNVNLAEKKETSFYGAPKDFIKSIFDQFGYEDIIKFFNDLGVELYTERKTNIGKVFPVTDQAQTITSLLVDELERKDVQVFLNTDCKSVDKSDDIFILQTLSGDPRAGEQKNVEFYCKNLILSAGGKTYPALGASGTGYELATHFGHTIIDPVPSALPIEGHNPMSQDLQGIKLEIEVTSIINGKEIKTRSDDVMFTKYGLSGPAILNISREISIHFNREHKNDCSIKLNFFPGKNFEEAKKYMEERWDRKGDQMVEVSMYGIFPNKVSAAILRAAKVENKQNADLSLQDKEKILNVLINHRINITGTLGWEQAEFTAGGVSSDEVMTKTLESKKCKSMFLCGEIIDVDGDVGGFNLSWSWASGFVAGRLNIE